MYQRCQLSEFTTTNMSGYIKNMLEEMRTKQNSLVLGTLVMVSAIFVSVAISYHLALSGINNSATFHQETLEEKHAFINRTIATLVSHLRSDIATSQAELSASTEDSLNNLKRNQNIAEAKMRNLAKKVRDQHKDDVTERGLLQDTLTEHIDTSSNNINARIDKLARTFRKDILELQINNNGTEDDISELKENIADEKESIEKVQSDAEANTESMNEMLEKMKTDRDAVKNITQMYRKIVITSKILSNTNIGNNTDLGDLIEELEQTMRELQNSKLNELFKDYNETIRVIMNQQADNQNRSIEVIKDAVEKVYEGLRSFMYKSLGYVKLGDAGMYHVWNIQSKSFSEAKSACETILGHLVEFEEKKEEDILLAHMRETYDDQFSFWIGAKDELREDKFEWDSSGVELSFTNWYDGEPNNAGTGEDCVEVSNFQKWNDLDCDDHRMFVCEFDTKNDIELLI